jgi:outer membrane protein assembly factor BamD
VNLIRETATLKTGLWRGGPARAAWCLLALASLLFQAACGLKHRGPDLGADIAPGDQPDKILYERAMGEIQRGRYDVGRLTLQTLLNTYPDSEYLAKAKLAIADSYYAQGGVSGLTQSEAEYGDFITFFPTAPEAPEAQFRIGMAHYRLMGKADRDLTETRLAEAEFKEFLLKYPDSPTMPRVKGRLRQVQEVLAQGEFEVAKFYFDKGANRAARSRFEEIADNYPNFSQADQALWYLGQTLERLKTPNEAILYYARILTDYPLSPLVGDAKGRLTAMHQPIPRATKATMARAHADAFDQQQHRRSMFQKIVGVMASTPDVSATRRGPVVLGPRPPSQTAMAGGEQGGVSGNSISVQSVGEEGLKSGKAVAAPAEGGESNGVQPTTGTETRPKESEKPPDPSTSKKKGKFHFLKKVVKPF